MAEDRKKLLDDLVEKAAGGDESSRDEFGGSGAPAPLVDKTAKIPCPACGSKNVIQATIQATGSTFVCLSCKKEFKV